MLTAEQTKPTVGSQPEPQFVRELQELVASWEKPPVPMLPAAVTPSTAVFNQD